MFSTAAFLSLGLLASFTQAAVIDVTVGSSTGQTIYTPEAVSAMPGDQVVFHFEQKNHTVTQSSFAGPCSPLAGGFNSGFMPVAANVTDNFPTYTITVNDTKPIWVYCAQAANTPASHCGMGMVFAVNCGADGSANSFTNFKASALAIGAALNGNATSSSAVPYGAPSATSTVDATDATSTPVATSTGTGSAAAATHTVVVGGNATLTFNPSEVVAAPNDVVVFSFQSKNHTITQSAFASPCVKLATNATTGLAGFDSGFMPVAANSTNFPSYSIVINDTTPIWAYCQQTNPTSHCGAGMVFAVNPVDSGAKSFTAFQALAKQLNGTASNTTSTNTTSSSSPASSSSSSAAPRLSVGLGFGLACVGAVFTLWL